MLKRTILALSLGAVMSTVGFASASVLNVEGGVIQYGEDTVLTCDEDGLTAAWSVDPDTEAILLTVGGINASCQGSTLTVKAGSETFTKVLGAGDTTVSWPYTKNPPSVTAIKMWLTR